MSDQQKISLTPEAERLIAGMQTLPSRVMNYIAAAMNQENLRTVSYIQARHLTGRGPFPVAEHRLGVVTNRLRQSLWASEAQPISGNQVESAIGTNVKYAALHEFGGVIHHASRQMKVRHKLDARGNLVKQLSNEKLLVFAKAGAKRVRETTVQTKAYDTHMPERAPIRTGIAECLPKYKQTISAHIVEAWKGLS